MKTTLFAASLLAAAAFTGLAQAAPVTVTGTNGTSATVTATDATGASSSPFMLADFGNANTNGFVSNASITKPNYTVTFPGSTGSGGAGVYDGSVANVAASAYANTNLAASNYLVAEPNSDVLVTYNAPRNTFQLLWGTVDSYNSLKLSLLGTNGAVLSTFTVTGTDVRNSGGFSGPSPAFVTIDTGSTNFNSVDVSSTTSAFEFVPARANATAVPEPASMALVGAGLAGLGLVRRRRKSA